MSSIIDNFKQYHAGDVITARFRVNDVKYLTGINSAVYYNPEFVELTDLYGWSNRGLYVSNELNDRIIFALLDTKGYLSSLDGSAEICVLEFTALKDFNLGDTGIFEKTFEIVAVNENDGDKYGLEYYVNNNSGKDNYNPYTSISLSVEEKTSELSLGDKYTVTFTVTSPDDTDVKTPVPSSVSIKSVSKNTLVYTAVYDPKSGTFISDYVPKPGDTVTVTVSSKKTGEVVKKYSYTFPNETILPESNGLSIILEESITTNEEHQTVETVDVELKADVVDTKLIEETLDKKDTETPSTPDVPEIPTDTDKTSTSDVPENPTDTDKTSTSDVPENPTDTDKTSTPDVPEKPTTYKLGDVNGDNKITAKDSMLIQRRAVNLVKFSDDQLKTADVNGDGKVSASDALSILRYTVNLKGKYPIGEVITA